jgi:uncharacterized protein (DUF608 family)
MGDTITSNSGRRAFLKTLALTGSMASADAQTAAPPGIAARQGEASATAGEPAITYPRHYTGRQLAELAFPLGGIGTGSISLGGRGQLGDWEIFNRPDKGRSPDYGFAGIWVRSGNSKPVARVLEARLMTPYQSARGLGPDNSPGLPRLEGAVFTGDFPFAQIAFRDSKLPVKVALEAFSPFIPLDPEESGLPVAILRYRVTNPLKSTASVAIVFAVDNPVGMQRRDVTRRAAADGRMNEYREDGDLQGLLMRNTAIPESDPLAGSFALSVMNSGTGKLTYVRGWRSAKWWASTLLFWDSFKRSGELAPEAPGRNQVGTLSLKREIAPRGEAEYVFLLSWRFPNRTAEWSGWLAPKGDEKALLGNHYCARFADAWQAAEYAARNLSSLEERSRQFATTLRKTTLPAVVKDAAVSNLSTLRTQTCFRTADGEFHGFEGCDDQRGCCFGNCTHVWNYETATQYLFPSLARSLRRSAFGFSEDQQGAMRHRQLLPDGKERYNYAAADGQMGQIMKAYMDWNLSGDSQWLREMWPRVKRAIEFAWKPGSWDADRDGVMEGVQHNTYDVEFYGPNPQCGIFYLGALRAAEEMARAVGDRNSANEYRRLFIRGSKWIDENLFNGQYYIQKIRSIPKDRIAPVVVSKMGSDRQDTPEFQLGEGCLVDQLVGQYLAEVAGLGPLLSASNVRKALESIHQFNYKRHLYEHESVQRVFALNDESALVICDYGIGKRPEIPFPYFAEVMTGFEYQAAIHMIYAGMISEGVECIENIRRRYDGERRNPWDEAECGHHYARAMASWSAIPATSGFHYICSEKSVIAAPRVNADKFFSFWSTATGWGGFSHRIHQAQTRLAISATEGLLEVRSVKLSKAAAGKSYVAIDSRPVKHQVMRDHEGTTCLLDEDVTIKPGETLAVKL